VKRLRRVGEGAYVGAVSEDRKAAQEAADRIEKLEMLVEQLRDDNSSLIDSFDKDFLRQGDRIEKLEAVLEVATMKRIINTDRIEKLEAALRDVFSLGEWGTSALARTIILEALDEKD
jgi:hypothetical protein